MKKLIILILVMALCSCAEPVKKEQATVTATGDKFWTLDFFHFYKGKQTHTESFKFVNRRDCFDTLYLMQVNSKKQSFHSGAGICTKLFLEGEKRTQDDLLDYR